MQTNHALCNFFPRFVITYFRLKTLYKLFSSWELNEIFIYIRSIKKTESGDSKLMFDKFQFQIEKLVAMS